MKHSEPVVRIQLPQDFCDHAHEVWPEINYPLGTGVLDLIYEDGPGNWQVHFVSDDDHGHWSWPAEGVSSV